MVQGNIHWPFNPQDLCTAESSSLRHDEVLPGGVALGKFGLTVPLNPCTQWNDSCPLRSFGASSGSYRMAELELLGILFYTLLRITPVSPARSGASSAWLSESS